MIKVAIVLNSAWQGYNFRLNLARELKRSNYEVVFVAPDDGEYSHKLKKEFSFEDVDLKATSINPINDLRLCISLFKVYKKIKPNIVLNFTIKPNIYSAIVARILKIDSINNITGQGTVFIKKTFVTQIVKLLYKVSLLCTSFIFFQNSDDRNFFIDKKLVTLKKSDILPGSGVDTNKFCQIVRKDDKVFRFLMVARIIRDKGINEFIEAAKELNKNGIMFDHIDLQTIKPLDLKPIKQSLKKTKKLLVLDTISHPVCSIGSEILSQIYLDKEIKLSKSPILLTLPDIPSPTSSFYTKDFYVSKKDIVKKIEILTNKKISIKLRDNIIHDVPDLKFKGPF